MTFQVVAASTERLDRFLADQLALSRSQAGRLVGEGAVRVNGAPGRAGRPLTRGDTVEVHLSHAGPPPRTLAPYAFPLEIPYEDAHLLVLDKPAGLVVHPAPGHWSDTLVNVLIHRGFRPADDGAPDRLGLVHRLDRDTSGLMLVAKTAAAHRHLSRQLAARRVGRCYAALLWGHLGVREVDAPLARHPRDRKRVAVVATGRAARTRFESIGRFGVCDLVRATLETGRTHQIRVHAAHVGHPVIGDPVYGGGGARRVTGQQRGEAEAVERVALRQALHAAELSFTHPASGERLVFRSDWPADLRSALAAAAADRALLARPSVLYYLGFFK